MQQVNKHRRWFIKAVAGTGAAIAIGPTFSFATNNNEVSSAPWCVYVTINKDNSVLMSSPVMDMGQHMKTTGPMILADEMELDWSLIEFTKDCPAWLTKDEEGNVGYQYSDMGTGGSHAVRRNWQYLREAGATVRQMLIQEAAERWQVSAASLKARDSYVINTTTKERLSYGELAEKAANQKVASESVKLKDKSEYRIMGKDATTIDIKDLVTGKPMYGLDMDYPNALQAVIHRTPQIGATVDSFDQEAALKIKGVQAIIEVPGTTDTYWSGEEKPGVTNGVAVLADSLWAALKGKAALNTKWQASSKYQDQNSAQQLADFHKLVNSDTPATKRKNTGDAMTWLNGNPDHLDETYETPLFAHACMEPFNCIADIRDKDATIITGHQFPDAVATEVEQLTGIDALKVEVIGKRMGGGFGRRWERDYIREAIWLSKTLKQPVKVTWTREDEIEHDYFAPAYVMRIQAGTDENGKVQAWRHRQAQTRGGARDDCFPNHVVPNFRSEHFTELSKIPTGPWRGPGHMQWTFACESMIDELAVQQNRDPYQFRMDMMKPYKAHPYEGWGGDVIDSGRMAKCYEAAANIANWQQKRPEGHGLGIAGHFTFGSYAAFVVEVQVKQDMLQIINAWGAIDCGLPINPNHIRNQMEGGFIDGLNAALFNKVNIKAGAVVNNNFHSLPFMRMTHSPLDVKVAIIENDHAPTGVGEPPTAPAAAALTNAIYAASGKRIRKLPISEHIGV